jgi:cytochrome c553
MTKAQIWIAVFVVLFIILYVVQMVTPSGESAESNSTVSQSPNASEQGFDPKVAVVKFNCVSCHGADLKGSGSGPSLVGLSSYYTADKLVAFLKEPHSFANEPRHKDRVGKYPLMMPSFSNKDEQELLKVTEYLLSLH